MAAYEAVSGIEAQFFRELVGPAQAAQRAVFASMPASPSFIISNDPEKGIRLHFDPCTTSPELRNAMWAKYASVARAFRAGLNRSVLFRVRSRFFRPVAMQWLEQLVAVVTALESKSEPPKNVGSYFVDPNGA
jgi:hypothetical protein